MTFLSKWAQPVFRVLVLAALAYCAYELHQISVYTLDTDSQTSRLVDKLVYNQ
jgi:hypothetical protein